MLGGQIRRQPDPRKTGRSGGLALARAPEEIAIGAVVRRLEPDLRLVECFDPATSTCPIAPVCGLSTALHDAQAAFLAVLDRVSLKQAGAVTQWRVVAKDAVDLPPSEAKLRLADQLVSVGETYDVEYETTTPQELTLEGLSPNDMRRAVQTFVFADPPR